MIQLNAEKVAKSLDALDKQNLEVGFYRLILNHYFEVLTQELRNIDFALISGCFTNAEIDKLVAEKWNMESVLQNVAVRLQEINM